MKTLMIKDLCITEELDRSAMAAVHGGRLGLLGIYSDYDSTFKSRIDAKQLIADDLADVVVERKVVEYLPRARWCKQLQIVNDYTKP